MANGKILDRFGIVALAVFVLLIFAILAINLFPPAHVFVSHKALDPIEVMKAKKEQLLKISHGKRPER